MATQRFSAAPPGFVPAAAYDRLQALCDSQAARLLQAELPDGWLAVPPELIKEAIESIDDYRCGLEFGKHDRRVLGMLKAVLRTPPAANEIKDSTND